jgi:PqqD family protein of HPr-rel-A system
MPDNQKIWTVPDYLQLRWHSWGEAEDAQFVVFNSFSGETHCLNFTAALALEYLEAHAANADTLCAAIRQALPAGAETDALQQIAELLSEFDQVGLIAPVRP